MHRKDRKEAEKKAIERENKERKEKEAKDKKEEEERDKKRESESILSFIFLSCQHNTIQKRKTAKEKKVDGRAKVTVIVAVTTA